jgi:hypothetical protein
MEEIVFTFEAEEGLYRVVKKSTHVYETQYEKNGNWFHLNGIDGIMARYINSLTERIDDLENDAWGDAFDRDGLID